MQEWPVLVAMLITAAACLAGAARSGRTVHAGLVSQLLVTTLVSSALWSAVSLSVALGEEPAGALLWRASLAGAWCTASATWLLVRSVTDPAWNPARRVVAAVWAGPPLLLLAVPVDLAGILVEAGTLLVGTSSPADVGVAGAGVSWDRVLLTLVALLVLGRLRGRRRSVPVFARRPLATLSMVSALAAAATAATVPVPDLLGGVDHAPLAWALVALTCSDVLVKNNFANLAPLSARQVLESLPDAVLVVDGSGRLVSMNRAAERLTVPPPGRRGDLLGRNADDVLPRALSPRTHDAGSASIVTVGGLRLETRTDSVRDARGHLAGQVITYRDVTDLVAQQVRTDEARRRAERESSRLEDLRAGLAAELSTNQRERTQLAEQAVHDPLTGLHNRRHLEPAMQVAMHDARASRGRAAVFVIDVDHFKKVNDTHGHDVGDRVLQALARELVSCRRTGETIIRFGGEEFVIVAPDLGPFDALMRAEDLRRGIGGIRVPVRDGDPGPQLGVTVSIGISSFPEHGESPGSLLAAADYALYAAKAAGRDCVVSA